VENNSSSIDNSNKAEKLTKENSHPIVFHTVKNYSRKNKRRRRRLETQVTLTSAVKAAAAMKRPFGDMSAILFFN